MESELQAHINQDLRDMRIGFFHRESSGRKLRTHNTWKFDSKDKKEKKKSWPDLLIMPGDERLFYVEIKTKEGRLKEEQKNFLAWAQEMNYKCYVVNSIEDWNLVKRIELKERA